MKPISCLAKLLTGCVMGDGEESRTKGTKGEKGPLNSMAIDKGYCSLERMVGGRISLPSADAGDFRMLDSDLSRKEGGMPKSALLRQVCRPYPRRHDRRCGMSPETPRLNLRSGLTSLIMLIDLDICALACSAIPGDQSYPQRNTLERAWLGSTRADPPGLTTYPVEKTLIHLI